jgi:hypothetical protein
MNEDLVKLYTNLKTDYPNYMGDTTEDEFVGNLSNRGEFTKWVNTVEDYLPGYFDGVNKQDVINQFHPLNQALEPQAKVRDAKIAEYTKNLNNTPLPEQPVGGGSAAQQDRADFSFFQANRAAQEDRPRADAAIRERAVLEAFQIVPPDLSNFTEADLYEFTHPGKAKTQIEHSELLSAGLNRRLGPDGKMTIVTGGRSAAAKVAARLTPTEIMAAQPGEIPGIDDERLLSLKQIVSDDDRIEQQQKFKELSLYSDVLSAQVQQIPKEYFDAYNILNDAVAKQEAGELDEDTYKKAQSAQEYLKSIPEETENRYKTILQKTGELETTLKTFDQKYPDVVLTDKLNQQIQNNKDKAFTGRNKLGLGLLSMITSGGLLPGDLTASLGEAIVEAPGRLIGKVGSSLESWTAPFDPLAADIAPDFQFRDATAQTRGITEKVADIPYNGKTYQIGFNDEGKPTQVYDETGNVAQIPSDKKYALLADASKRGLAETSRRQWNKDATYNAIGDASSDLLGTMALTAMSGGLGAGTWVSRIRELGSVMLQYSGTFAEEAIRNGATVGQAAAIGLGDSALEGATEAIFPFAAKVTGRARFSELRDNLRRIIQADDPAAVKSLAMKQFRAAITGIPMEGLEEDLADIGHPILNRAYNNFFDLELDTEAPDAHQLLESFGLGAAVSVIPGLLGGIKNAKQVGTNEFLAQSIFSAVKDIEGVNKVIGDFSIPNTRDFQSALQTTAAQVKPYLEQKNLSEAKKVQITAMTFAAEYAKVQKARVQSTPYEADLERQQKEAEDALKAQIDSIDPNEEIATAIGAGVLTPEVAPLTTNTPTVDALNDVGSRAIQTPEGFENRIHEGGTSLGEAGETSHITDPEYTYRTIGESEVNAIRETQGVYAREGKQKGGNKNVKYWSRGDGKFFFRPNANAVIRVKNDNIKVDTVVSADNLEIWDKQSNTFIPFNQGTNSTQTTENTNPEAREDEELFKLSEKVSRAQQAIAQAENPEAAIAAFNQAKQEKADFENSIQQRKESIRRKDNVAYLLEDEKDKAQRPGYPHTDLYAKDPRLAILAELKDDIAWVESGDAEAAFIQQGFSSAEAKQEVARVIERSNRDIADLEADLQENQSGNVTRDVPTQIHEKLDNLPATAEGGVRRLTRADAASTVEFARGLNHPEVNRLLDTYDKESKKNKGKAFSNLYNGLRFVADVLRTPLTEQEQSDLNTVIQSQIDARNANQPKRLPRGTKPVGPSGTELFQELYDVLRTVPTSVSTGEGGGTRFYSATEQAAREAQVLKAYADANGLMLPALAQQFPNQTSEGGFESLVYFEGAQVVKAKANNFYNSWTELIESVQAQGEIFPSTAYTVRGFTIEQGNFRIVVGQPTIQKGFPVTFDQILEDMEKRGFKMVKGMPGDMPLFIKDDIAITDLHPENVYQDENGLLYYIDPIIQSAEFPNRVGVGQMRDFFPQDFDEDAPYVEQYPDLAQEEKATVPEAVISLRGVLRAPITDGVPITERVDVIADIAAQLGDKELIDAINDFVAGNLSGPELENVLFEAAYTKQYERVAETPPIETGIPFEPVDPNAPVEDAPLLTEIDNVTAEQQESIDTVVNNIARNIAQRLGISISDYLRSIRTVIVDAIPKFGRTVDAVEYNKAIQTLNPAFREANAPGETVVEPMKVQYQEPITAEQYHELMGKGMMFWDFPAADILKQKYGSPKFQVGQFKTGLNKALKELLGEIKNGKYTLKEVTDKQLDAEIAVAEANNDQQQVQALQNLKTNPQAREQYLNYIRNNQQESLDAWVNYVANPHNNYDEGFQYVILYNVASRLYEPKYALTDTGKVRMSGGVPVIEKWETLKRSPQTLKGFPPVFSDVVAILYNNSDSNIEILESIQILNQEAAQANKEVFKSDEKGEWVIFKGKENNPNYQEDAKTLAAMVSNTPWCLKSDGTAKSYLESGDLYIYLTKDEKGNFTVPRIGAAVNNNGTMREIRGIEGGSAQELEDSMLDTAEGFLKENIWGGDTWLQGIQGRKEAKKLTDKLKSGTLTKDDALALIDLYNIYTEGSSEAVRKAIKEVFDTSDSLTEQMLRLGLINHQDEVYYAFKGGDTPKRWHADGTATVPFKYAIGAVTLGKGDYKKLERAGSVTVVDSRVDLSGLKKVGSIELRNNDYSDTPLVLNSLEEAGKIQAHSSNISLPKLQTATTIQVVGNYTTIDAPVLHTVGDLRIEQKEDTAKLSFPSLGKVETLYTVATSLTLPVLREASLIRALTEKNGPVSVISLPNVTLVDDIELGGNVTVKIPKVEHVIGILTSSTQLGTKTVEAEKLKTLDLLSVDGRTKLVTPELKSIRDIRIYNNGSEISIPSLVKIESLDISDQSKFIAPNLKHITYVTLESQGNNKAAWYVYAPKLETVYSIAKDGVSTMVESPTLLRTYFPNSDKATVGEPTGRRVRFQGNRGAHLSDKKTSTILLSRKEADATTEIHEWIHEFEKVLTTEEKDTIRKWAGHKRWTDKTSEAFAKGGELYLYEGQTGNPKMKSIFDKFKEWLRDLFATDYFKDINTLTPEMRKIYDTVMSSPVVVEAQAALAPPVTTGEAFTTALTEENYMQVFETFTPLEHDYTIVQDVKNTHEKIFNALYADAEYTRNAIDVKGTKAAMYGLIENVIFDLGPNAVPFLQKVLNNSAVGLDTKRTLTRAVIEKKYFAPEILNRDFKPVDKALATITSTMMNVGKQFDSSSDYTTEDQRNIILNILAIGSTFNNVDNAITQAEDSNIVPEQVQQAMEEKTVEELNAEIKALEEELKEAKEEKKTREVRINKVKAEGRKVLLTNRLKQEYGDDYMAALKAKIDEVAKKCK